MSGEFHWLKTCLGRCPPTVSVLYLGLDNDATEWGHVQEDAPPQFVYCTCVWRIPLIENMFRKMPAWVPFRAAHNWLPITSTFTPSGKSKNWANCSGSHIKSFNCTLPVTICTNWSNIKQTKSVIVSPIWHSVDNTWPKQSNIWNLAHWKSDNLLYYDIFHTHLMYKKV